MLLVSTLTSPTRLSMRAAKDYLPYPFSVLLLFNTRELRSFAGAHLWIAKWWTQGDVPGGSGASYV